MLSRQIEETLVELNKISRKGMDSDDFLTADELRLELKKSRDYGRKEHQFYVEAMSIIEKLMKINIEQNADMKALLAVRSKPARKVGSEINQRFKINHVDKEFCFDCSYEIENEILDGASIQKDDEGYWTHDMLIVAAFQKRMEWERELRLRLGLVRHDDDKCREICRIIEVGFWSHLVDGENER